MKKTMSMWLILPAVLVLSCASSVLQMSEIDTWLISKAGNDAPTINVSGTWQDMRKVDNWGNTKFFQNGNTVTGELGDFMVKGMVSGNKLFLVITYSNSVSFTANLEQTKTDELKGSYYYVNDKDQKTPYPMALIKVNK
jgi:hypothetical protein